jgi:subtilisin family serine protease/PKD repeat protein
MRSVSALTFAASLSLVACNADLQPGQGLVIPSVTARYAERPSSKFLRSSNRVPGQYIVVLQPDAYRDAREVAQELSRSYRGQMGRVFRHALRGFVAHMSEADARALAEDPRVKYVEEDGEVRAVGVQSGATWGLDRIDQADLPVDQTYTYTTAGAGVNAYIIDTGIRITHSEFDGRASHGYSSIVDGYGADDCNGHGTHVAGTVGGATWGVAKGVNLVAVRVLDCAGSGSYSGVIAGVDWVTQNHVKPAVANMSLGGSASQSVDDAVTASIAAGVVYAIAAGNDNGDACLKSPARTPNALTVGSTTNTDARSSFSNYGACVDIFAPGSSITSAWYTSNIATNTISGTSMASPHVAGAAVLYLSTNPTATPDQVGSTLTNNAAVGRVTGAGTNSPNLLLYTAFLGNGSGDVIAPTASLTAPVEGTTVAGAVTLSVSASDDVGITRVSFFLDGVFVGADTTAPYEYTWDTTRGSNGSHALMVKAYDAGGNVGSSTAVTVTVNNPGIASYDAARKVPTCATVGASCDTGTLADGRGTMGPEKNAPNTLDASCIDGSSGAYHKDESLDRLRVSTLDGSPMAAGKTVKIEATVWAWSTGGSDSLDLYYTSDVSNPTWTFLTTLRPAAGGAQVLSTTYTLPSGGMQAVRGNFRYDGTVGSCTTGSYDDRDDLVFAVGSVSESLPPSASFSSSCSALSCGFTDTSTDPNGDISSWSWSFGDNTHSTTRGPSHSYVAAGTYTVTLTVTDSQGQTSTTQKTVTVTHPSVISLSTSAYKSKGTRYVDLTWSGAATTNVDVFRNGVRVTTTANGGAYIDSVSSNGTYTYRVCEAGTNTCSNESSAAF